MFLPTHLLLTFFSCIYTFSPIYHIFLYIFSYIFSPNINPLSPVEIFVFLAGLDIRTQSVSLALWGGGGLYIYILIYIFLCIFSYIYFLIYIFLYIFSYIYFPQILTPLSPVGRPGHPDAVCFLGTWGGWQVRDMAHILSSAFFFFMYV